MNLEIQFDRRTLLKATAAIAGAGGRVGPEIARMLARTRLFYQWCDPERAPGYRLTRPWLREGHVYATCGRAAIRTRAPVIVPREPGGRALIGRELRRNDDQARVPDIAAIWREFWKPRGPWRELPPESLIRSDGPCPACCEMPYQLCPRCKGEWVDPDAIGGCRLCRGHIEITDPRCPVCSGVGMGMYPNRQRLADKLLGVIFLRRWQRMPGLRWNPGLVSTPSRPAPLLAIWRSCEMMVMPVLP